MAKKYKRSISVLRWIYNKSIKWWIFSAILPNIPTLFLLVSVFGPDLGLKNADGTLKSSVLYIGLGLYLPSILFTFLKSSADRWNERGKETTQKIVGVIIQYLTTLKEFKLIRFVGFMPRAAKNVNPFQTITEPITQINLILESLRGSLSKVLGINNMNVGVSVIYKIDDCDWDWLASINIVDGMKLETIVSNTNTTAYHVINNSHQFLFYADKRSARDENCYLCDARDSSHKNIGSIYCSNITITNHNHKIQAVLSVSSYGEQFCRVSDDEIEQILTQTIFPAYEMRLKVELALYYIKVKSI